MKLLPLSAGAAAKISRVVLRFGMFGWYRLVLSWYFTNQYQRKTWLVHFGIVNLAGTYFSLERGALAPFLMHPSPLFEEHRSSCQIFHKRSFRQTSQAQIWRYLNNIAAM
jgi:hypothetical protein